MKKLFLTLTGILAVAASASAQIVYDFNVSQADVDAKFSSTGTISSAWQSTAGVNNTGRLNGNPGGAIGVFWNTGQAALTVAGGSVDMQVDFMARVGESAGSGSASLVGLGISDTGTGSNFQSGSGTFLALTLNTAVAASNTSFLQLTYRDASGGGTQTPASSAATTLVNNNWYQLRSTITRVDAGTFSISGSLWDIGVNGTTTPTQIGSTLTAASITTLNTLEADTSIFYGFAEGQQSGGGAKAIDNFSAIPEPTTWALLAGSLTALVAFRRRRA